MAVVLDAGALESALVPSNPVGSRVGMLAGTTDHGGISAAPSASLRIAYFQALAAMSTPSRRTRGTLAA